MRPGAIGYLGVTAGATADGKAFTLVRFEDEAAAKANAERPEQGAWFESTWTLYDAPPTFTESSDTTEFLGGGSNDAGFVQVMKSTGVDRAKIERIDKIFEASCIAPTFSAACVSGPGPDSLRRDVAYFTTEAEARKGSRPRCPTS